MSASLWKTSKLLSRSLSNPGLELVGEATVEGQSVDRVVGLKGVRSDIALMRTPDGHSRLELTKFQAPPATTTEPNAPVNTLGIRRIMFAEEFAAKPLGISKEYLLK